MSVPPYTNMPGGYYMQTADGLANQMNGMTFSEPVFGAAPTNQGPLAFDEASGLPHTTAMPFTGHPSHAAMPRNMPAGGAFPMGPGHGSNMTTGQNWGPSGEDLIKSEEEHATVETTQNPEAEDPNMPFRLLFAAPGKVPSATEILESLRGGKVILDQQKAQAEQKQRKLAGSTPKRTTRKPRATLDNPAAVVRRREQNCQSQRQFRMRKVSLTESLTEDVNTMSKQLASQCMVINEQLKMIKRLKQAPAATENYTGVPSLDPSSGVSANGFPMVPTASSVSSASDMAQHMGLSQTSNGLPMMSTAPSSVQVSPDSETAQQMGQSPASGVHNGMVYDSMGSMKGGLFDLMPMPVPMPASMPASMVSTDSMLGMSQFGDTMLYPNPTPGADSFFPGGPA